MEMQQALAASCDTYFYRLGTLFYDLPPERGHPLQAWASRFGIGASTGVDIGPEERGHPADARVARGDVHEQDDPCCWRVDRLWKPGDSIQLAIGQKDIAVTPLQMARSYALIANGGRLVTPHVVSASRNPAARTRHRPSSSFQPPPRAGQRRRSDGAPRDPPVRSTTRRTPRTARPRPSSATSRSRWRARRAPPRRSCSCPAMLPACCSTSRGSAPTRPPTSRRSRLRRDRERRPRRHGRRAGGAQGVRALLRDEGAGNRRHPLRLMGRVPDGSVRRHRPRDAPQTADPPRARRARSLLARLDWVLLAATGGLVAFGLWAISGITRHDVPDNTSYYVIRQLVFAVRRRGADGGRDPRRSPSGIAARSRCSTG